MKIPRVFNIDIEIVKQLDEVKNKSALVNALLKNHFDNAEISKTNND